MKPLSASAIQSYIDCPRRYQFERKIRPKVAIPYFMLSGQVWHETVRTMLLGPPNYNFDPKVSQRPFWYKTAEATAKAMTHDFWALVEKKGAEGGVDWGLTNPGAVIYRLKIFMQGGALKTPQGSRTYGGYFNRLLKPPAIFEQLEIVAVEKRYEAKIFGLDFVFKPDQIWRMQMNGQTKMALIDLTTSFRREIKHLQLLIYALAWQEKAKNDADFFQRFGVGPDLIFIHNVALEVLIPFHISENDFASLQEIIESAIAGIQGNEFPERAGVQCKFCPYRGEKLCNKENVWGGSLTWESSGTTVAAPASITPKPLIPKPMARQMAFAGARKWGKPEKSVKKHFCGDHPGEEAVWNGKAYICPQYVNE